jgi:hypothetical protein
MSLHIFGVGFQLHVYLQNANLELSMDSAVHHKSNLRRTFKPKCSQNMFCLQANANLINHYKNKKKNEN